jgi:hypothetical protein
MSERRRAGRLIVPSARPPADRALLEEEQTSFERLTLHADPWRVLRILSEFVEGFDALADLGPAVTVFGSARVPASDPLYAHGEALGEALARRGFAVITGGGPGIMEAGCRSAATSSSRTSSRSTPTSTSASSSATSSCARRCS